MQKFRLLYSYLSQTEKMSKEQNEQEAMRMVHQTTENILQKYSMMTPHEILPKEKLEQD